MRKQILAPIAAGVLIAFAGAAQAATKTASFTVSATVGKNCVISASDLSLGEFVGDNDLTQTSDIDIRCTAGTAYTISLNAGGSADYTARTMTNGTDNLVYNLYTSNLYAAVWGDDTGDTDVITGNGAGMGLANEITHTVYGRVLAADNDGPVSAGAYSDTIIATITY